MTTHKKQVVVWEYVADKRAPPRRVHIDDLGDEIGGGGAWGGITGTLADQTDLNSALDGKSSTSHNHDASYASSSHAHAIGDTTGLQSALDGKSATSHNHDASYSALGHNHNAAYDVIGAAAAAQAASQPASANLDEYAGVNPTTAGLALLDDADAAAQRTTLGAAAASHSHAAGDLPDLDGITAPNASVNFADQQALSFRIENRTSDPGTPTVGQIWLRTDL